MSDFAREINWWRNECLRLSKLRDQLDTDLRRFTGDELLCRGCDSPYTAHLAGDRGGCSGDFPEWYMRLREQNYQLTKERDDARSNYQFMVDRAADEKLDAYRELGARAADAENRRDDIARQLTAATERAERAERNLDIADGFTRAAREQRDRFMAQLDTAIADTQEQIAAWLIDRLHQIRRQGRQVSGVTIELSAADIRAGAWRKETP